MISPRYWCRFRSYSDHEILKSVIWSFFVFAVFKLLPKCNCNTADLLSLDPGLKPQP